MLKFLRDIKERKKNEMREMLELMQEMRQLRMKEVRESLWDLPPKIKDWDLPVQKKRAALLRLRNEMEHILEELSSNEQLKNWVRDWRSGRKPMLERALDRAMTRAVAEKREEWERKKWEEEKDWERGPREQDQLRNKPEQWEHEWEHEWEGRERQRRKLDSEELAELTLEDDKLRKRQEKLERTVHQIRQNRWWLGPKKWLEKGTRNNLQHVTEELDRLLQERAVLQSAQDWEQKNLYLDLENDSQLALSLESLQGVGNRLRPFALKTEIDEQELLQMQKKYQSLIQVYARLERDEKRDARALQEASSDWQRLNQLADEWLTMDPMQDRLPLAEKDVKEIGHQRHLLDVILGNQSTFSAQSAYLDALLVFAGLFSAILSAFLIEIRKGLQEDLLLQILHELQSATTQQPFQPTPVSIWVNGLWFSSLAASLVGAVVVMLAKSLGRWIVGPEEAYIIFSKPEGLRRRLKEIKRFYIHIIFQYELAFLIGTASILIYLALTLFFAGLAVLLYTSQRNIGISFATMTSLMGLFVLCIAIHNIYSYGK